MSLKLFKLLCIVLLSVSPVVTIAQLDTSYFLPPPPWWHLIGEATSGDYQMCYGYGDFNNDGISELTGNYSHSSIGFFIHKRINGKWIKTIIHQKFDPSNHIKGMDGSWPVKGFTSGDFDGDGSKEIITYADQIMYPPAHQTERFPFPGCIYIDWDNTNNKFIANPLVWGKWGEEIGSNKAAIMTVTPISPAFRSDGHTYNLKDFLVRTMCNDVKDSRLFVLEQPKETFNSFDYRYITPDSIDADTLFPHDAFYVHRFYLKTDGGDFELYFSHSESIFKNVTTASCNGNIFDYDNDGLFDLLVTVEYYDNDSSFIMQHCGTSIRIYHRLPAKENRKYRFELAFQKDLSGIGFGQPIPANLNGNKFDGKEGWIMPVHIDTSMSNDLNTAAGVAVLYKDGNNWKITGTHYDSNSVNPYIGVYSGVTVYDANGDGYDDAVIKLDKESRIVPYDSSEKYMIGDIVLFRNMRPEKRNYDEIFTHSLDGSKILWANDAITWDLHPEDFDEDGTPELGCALSRREPAWANMHGKFGVYYTELAWDNTSIQNHSRVLKANPMQLYYNYPNPFINSTTIHFYLFEDRFVNITLYNVLGEKINSFNYGLLSMGNHNIIIDGSELNNGIYFYKVSANNFSKVGRMIIIK